MSVHLVSDEKIAETSSKGNQEKWLENGRWYKLDKFGYEALAETLISGLLERSGLERSTKFQFVRYRMERICVHGRERTGCSSENFLEPGRSIVTLSHLLRRLEAEPLSALLSRLPSDRKRVAFLAERTAELTGLSDFPEYLALLFELDARFLNDDRHLNNIAVLEKNGKYDYCPIFDNGAGLLSNVMTAPLEISPKAFLPAMRASPFQMSFSRQLHTVQSLYGAGPILPEFSEKELREELAPLLEYYPSRDRALIADRVCTVILERQRK